MKKLITYFLVVIMIAAFPGGILALNGRASLDASQLNITEIIDSKNRITRVLERDSGALAAAQTGADVYESTKALLLELGMEQAFVEKLSLETLAKYASSPRIYSVVAYTKTDAQNNVTYLAETAALQEVAEAKALREGRIESIQENQMQAAVSRADEEGEYEDSYMRITYFVSYLGDATYLFSTDAQWLMMPSFRDYDSVGSCAQNATVVNSTRSGWYEYDVAYIENGNISRDYGLEGTISSVNRKNAINGSWYGSAGVIRLPHDVQESDYAEVYDNYNVHYQYEGHVNYPNVESYFNTTASYDHATVNWSLSPSLSIDINGPSASIGVDITGWTDKRTAELDSDIHYIPD